MISFLPAIRLFYYTRIVFKKWEGDEEDWEPINHITKQNFPLEKWTTRLQCNYIGNNKMYTYVFGVFFYAKYKCRQPFSC